jgi:hypothetical protein
VLDRLVIEKLQAKAETLRVEGWKWIVVAPDFPYGHTAGLRQLDGQAVDLTDEERASRAALQAELERLEQQYAAVRGWSNKPVSRPPMWVAISPADRWQLPNRC